MGIVDFHNHLMPAVDDGAQSVAESSHALKAFKDAGVSAIVATPHVAASVTVKPRDLQNRMRELDFGFAELQACAATIGSVRVERGVELALDIPEPDLTDARLRLAGGSFFLMEFPAMTVPPGSERVLRALSESGYTPIIAHPERYYGMVNAIELAGAWRAAGAYLQVNNGSLIGRYGPDARHMSFELLRHGWVDYLSSDYHARGPTLVGQCWSLLETLDAREQAFTLMKINPSRMLEGNPPLPVQPLRTKATLWSRVAAVFRS
jgi:protein-tyrosine phosphatase